MRSDLFCTLTAAKPEPIITLAGILYGEGCGIVANLSEL
jgi:hypothetical protein